MAQPNNIIRLHCPTTYVDAAYCYRLSSVVCQSVCRCVTVVSPAKTAELIEMLFGRRHEWAKTEGTRTGLDEYGRKQKMGRRRGKTEGKGRGHDHVRMRRQLIQSKECRF